MKNDRNGGKRTNWLLIKHRDEYARDATKAQKLIDEDASVASGRSMSDIAAGKGRAPKPFMLDTRKLARADAVWNSKANSDATPSEPSEPSAKPARRKRQPTKQQRAAARKVPQFIEPELCKLVERPPDGEQWAHEAKLDGYRMQLRVAAHEATLKTRKGLDWTDKFAADRGRSQRISRTASSTAKSLRSMPAARRISRRCRPRCPKATSTISCCSRSTCCTSPAPICASSRCASARSCSRSCSSRSGSARPA